MAVAFASSDDGLNPSVKFFLIEGFGQEVIRPYAKAFYFCLNSALSGYHQDRRIDPGGAHATHDLVPLDVGEHQIQHHDVVIVVPSELKRFFSALHLVDHETIRA